jgi:hypothetical protein
MANALLLRMKRRKKLKPEWGTKRTCQKCSTHFYDLGKVTFKCSKCDTSYTADDFILKNAKTLEGLNRKEGRKKSSSLTVEPQIEDIEAEINTDLDEGDLIEDAADLDDEDVPEVIKPESETD